MAVDTDRLSTRFEVEDSIAAVEFCYQQGWTDGLPVVPPVESRVHEFLEYAGREPDEVVGVVSPRRRAITAEKVAINAVMAGCLPAYLPVVLAAVEAMTDEQFNLHGCTASTGGIAPLVVVSGPAVQDLGMNGGLGALGPGNRANATIGRAIRLVLMNAAGAVPGELDRSTLGHPGKYCYCLGEDEQVGWLPLHAERGLPAEVSAVTVFAAEAGRQVSNHFAHSAAGVLIPVAAAMAPSFGFARGEQLVILVPEHRQRIIAEGWSKADVRTFLAERARRSVAELKRDGALPGEIVAGDQERFISAVSGADEVLVVAAGGPAGGFSAVIPPWIGATSRAVTRAVGVCIDCA